MPCRNTVADFAAKGQQHRWKRRIQKRQELGARERTRTSTTLRSLAPEASASASSATRARVKRVGPDEPTRLARHFQFCPRAFALSTRGELAEFACERWDRTEEHAPGKTWLWGCWA